MCKRLLICFVVLLLAGTTSFATGPVGIFDNTQDVGTNLGTKDANPLLIGSTQYVYQDQYLITAGGSDIWDWEDHFQYAYKTVSGDWRVSGSFAWQDSGWNDWAKMGVMLRADTGAGSVHFSTFTRKGGGAPWDSWVYGDNGDSVFNVARPSSPGGSTNIREWWGANPAKLGVQRINLGIANLSMVESLVDQGYGAGWELVSSAITSNLPSTYLAGVAVTSHDNAWGAQAWARNVVYEKNPTMFTQIASLSNPDGGGCMQQPGFMIRTVKKADGNWGANDNEVYQAMNDLLDGLLPKGVGRDTGPPDFIEISEESRISSVVNLYDSENNGRGEFIGDEPYPCVDPFNMPTLDPADGDGDDNFATEAKACIQLTAGYHIIAVNSDDGTIIKIGGVEIGRTGAWKGAGTDNFLFNVVTAGLYSFQARNLEGGGGAEFELHEVLADGTRILLGATDGQGNFLGSAVYVIPEPATVALLGLGGLALLRRKR